MQFGDAGALHDLAQRCRTAAEHGHAATAKGHANLQAAVHGADRYSGPVVQVLAATWDRTAKVLQRVVDHAHQLGTELDALARALSDAERRWHAALGRAAAAGFSVTGTGHAVRVHAPDRPAPAPADPSLPVPPPRPDPAEVRWAASLEDELRAAATDADLARQRLARVLDLPFGTGQLDRRRVSLAVASTGDGGLDGRLHEHAVTVVGVLDHLAHVHSGGSR